MIKTFMENNVVLFSFLTPKATEEYLKRLVLSEGVSIKEAFASHPQLVTNAS
jgi:hypothetical protein